MFYLLGFVMIVFVLVRVVEHTCAKAHAPVVPLQDVEVHTTFAAFPECGVVGKRGESDRAVSQFVVYFHNGLAGGQPENLSFGETLPRQFEGFALDAFGQPVTTISPELATNCLLLQLSM